MDIKIKVSPSILCADFTRLGADIKKCKETGTDMIHVDVMDGHFVPVITIGPIIVKAIRPLTDLPIETHLMIEHPGDHIDSFIEAGADIISLHAECYGPLKEKCALYGQFPKEVESINEQLLLKDINRIHEKKKKAFLVFNPGTPFCADPVLKDIDGILIMSVNPGFAGQKFMPEVLSKVREARSKFKGDIAIDGGINAETAPQAVKAGANILSTASYFFGAADPRKVVADLKSLPR